MTCDGKIHLFERLISLFVAISRHLSMQDS